MLLYCFFFFQAEDGIRDRNVTGVQTCALPISRVVGKHTLVLADDASAHQACPGLDAGARYRASAIEHTDDHAVTRCRFERSEERRVGKECRSRWCAYDYKKKK